MSRSVNKVNLLGHVGKDPEIKFTPSGAIVANLSLATNEPYKDPQGQWQSRTEWHRLACYSKQAEFARDFIKKGAKLYVEGKLQTRSWDKDGVTHYRTEVVVREFVFAGDAPAQAAPPAAAQAAPPPRRTVTEELEDTEITDADVPF